VTRSTEEVRQAAERARTYTQGPNHDPLRRLARAVIKLAEAKEEVTSAVLAVRAAGYAWSVVGRVLGISTNSAHQQYRNLTKAVDAARVDDVA
jgi:hypothetical protein